MFNESGSFIPSADHKVFSYPHSDYYQLNTVCLDSDPISSISKVCNISCSALNPVFESLLVDINQDKTFSNILRGIAVPFFIKKCSFSDIGLFLESNLLPDLNSSFLSSYPNSHFKVVTQDKQHLAERLSPVPGCGYAELINAVNNSDVLGYYFPFAFPEFSVSSQREALKSISSPLNYCLSGPLEIISASVVNPSLLINPDHYSPILCMSGVHHADNRLEAVLKSYGPHLEFWILSNVLTPGCEQLSEQWYGGITIYKSLI